MITDQPVSPPDPCELCVKYTLCFVIVFLLTFVFVRRDVRARYTLLWYT